MKQKIQFSGRHLDDIFSLPCVNSIIKSSDGTPFLIIRPEHHVEFPYAAYPGDWLIEEDNGKWRVEHEPRDPM